MTRWTFARWPLRLRVAAAFLGATAVAMLALAIFVHVRLEQALDERLRDTLVAHSDGLAALPSRDRRESVRELGGDVFAQVLTPEGGTRASSRLVALPLLRPDTPDGPLEAPAGYVEGTVEVFDDDAAAQGEREVERESALLLVRRTTDGYLVVGTSREDTDEALGQLRDQLLIGGLLSLVLAGGLGYAVAGAGLRPIEQMRARAATISDRSAGERLPLPVADDELRRLAITLNDMLERLADALQRERRFVAEASHDLRTPLTLMRTEIELALARRPDEDELARALHSTHDEVLRLIALAEHLLERARPTSGGLPIEAHPVDLVELAARVAERFRPSAGARAISITAQGPVTVYGDASRLDRALSNLVDNALRHGAGDIAIDLRPTDVGAAVTIADEGAGFLADDQTHPERTSLGLSIVREIVRAHSGRLDVHRIDHRTVVRVQLPASQP